MRRLTLLLTCLLVFCLPTLAQSDNLAPINILLDDAQQALDAGDAGTARALVLAARVLITADMVAACTSLEQARDLLDEAGRADAVNTIASFMASARKLIDLCAASSPPGPAVEAAEPLYLLAFYSDTDGNLETDDDREIIVILSDGQHISQTGNPVYSDFPLQWVSSTELLLSSPRDRNFDHLFIWDLASGRVRQITSDESYYYDGNLSPDGGTLAFVWYPDEDIPGEIYTMNIDGSDLTRLTDNDADDLIPVWSPDGRSIVFMSNRSGSWNIFSMDASGGSVRNLTNDSSNNRFPAWSPDGRRIVFGSDRGGTFDIYIMDANGSNLQQLTFHESNAARPAWSPDGRYIFYNLQINSTTFDIYRVDVASGETQAVYEGPGAQFAVRVGPEPVTEWTMP